MDRRRRGGETPLEYLQGEADVVALLAVALGKPLNAVHLGTHIFGHCGVERGLPLRELIFDRACTALGKQGPAVELEQFLLREPPHHVFGVGVVDAIAEPPLEAVAVEKRHKELEIFFFAIVWCCRHEQQMSTDLSELLPDLITSCVLDLSAEIGC